MWRSILLALIFPCLIPLQAEWDPQKLQTWEKETICEIFTTMAEKSVPGLLFEQMHLSRLGDKIQHIPPLQFLSYLLTDPYLKDCLRKISHSFFKWPYFLDGLQNNMESEAASGRLFHDLPYFAKLVKGDYNRLKELCDKAQWEAFVLILLS